MRILTHVVNSLKDMLSIRRKKAEWIWIGYGEDPFKK